MNHKKEYIILFVGCLLSSAGLQMGAPVYGIGAFIQFCTGVAIWYVIIMAIVNITFRIKNMIGRLINSMITKNKTSEI